MNVGYNLEGWLFTIARVDSGRQFGLEIFVVGVETSLDARIGIFSNNRGIAIVVVVDDYIRNLDLAIGLDVAIVDIGLGRGRE